MFLDPDTLERTLKREVGATIYSRGMDYFRRGKVRSWKENAAHTSGDSIRLKGVVLGTRMYRAGAIYDVHEDFFTELSCTCPYAIGCKHAVALVLAYAQSLRTDPSSASHANIPGALGTTEVRAALTRLGIRADAVPETLVRELLSFKKDDPAPAEGVAVAHGTQPFDPAEYMVILNPRRRYGPSFHRRGRHYEDVMIGPFLAHSDIGEPERAVLAYIKEHNAFGYAVHSAPADPSVLLPLIAASAFDVYCSDGYYGDGKPRPVSVSVEPPPISVSLIVQETQYPHLASEHGVPARTEIRAVLPDEREPGRGVKRSVWTKHGTVLVHETDTSIQLYRLPRQWVDIVSRSHAQYDPAHALAMQYMYHGTTLKPAELARLPKLMAEASPHIALTAEDAVRDLAVVRSEPVRTLLVNLDATEQYLEIVPVLDYGPWQSKLTERVSRRFYGYARYTIRANSAHDSKHVLVRDGAHLAYVPLQPKKEVEFYKLLEAHQAEIGFTKMLKCLHRGKGKVERYLKEQWPQLTALAAAHNIELVFTRDVLPKEKATFTAAFTSDADVENDWLHFDLDLYCAGEKVTLEKLYRYMESGANYWCKDDGTLVEIDNKEELERLVRLLQSFRAREEGGFEGKLHHAPELTYVITSSPHYSATQSKSLQVFMKKIESGKPVKKVRLPKRLTEILRPYQRAGVEWLYFLRSYHFAGILADDMGLGKTLQALTLLAQERVPDAPSLVVCPKSLLYNWRKEAETFFPDLKVLMYDGSPAERASLRSDLMTHDLVVVGYHTLLRDHSDLCVPGMRYNYAVLDEAQYIKNHVTKVAQRVKEIPADYRLALTGTPLENHVFELWSIYDYLMPGFLGKHDHFRDRFHKPIMEGSDPQALTHLRKKVESFMLRRTKEEVLAELPPKVEQVRECVLTDAQNVLYQQILRDVRGTVFDAVAAKGFKQSQIHILAGLTKLRQACNHPALLTKDKDYAAYESAKLDACLELVEEVRQGGRKVLIFSQFTGMLDILADALEKQGIEYAYLSGKTRKRQEVIERFNSDPDVTAFLISMKAGGVGLNLTAADNVIVFDPWWNPSVERQAVDRAHRIGQTRSVNVYRLLTKGTIEDKIQSLKNKKQNLFDAVVEESGELFKKLTWEDLRELFVE